MAAVDGSVFGIFSLSTGTATRVGVPREGSSYSWPITASSDGVRIGISKDGLGTYNWPELYQATGVRIGIHRNAGSVGWFNIYTSNPDSYSLSVSSISSLESLGNPTFTPSPFITIGPPSILSEENVPNPSFSVIRTFLASAPSVKSFSAELSSPILAKSAGNIFISPSFEVPNPINVLDVEYVESSTNRGDTYLSNKIGTTINQRPFVFGPQVPVPTGRYYPPDFSTVAPAYVPVFNSSFTLMGTTKRNVFGVLNTGGPDIYIFY